MLPPDIIWIYSLAAILLALAPGPDNIFVLTQSASFGPRAGGFVILGLGLGLLFHTTAVAFGVASLVAASPYAFTVIKVLGSLYLTYLAFKAWQAGKTTISNNEMAELKARDLIFRGLIMNVTNPKVTIFFLALLPQFVDPDFGPLVPQFYTLGAIMILAMVFVFSIVAIFAGLVGDMLRNSKRAEMIMNRITAVVLFGLALKLVFTQK